MKNWLKILWYLGILRIGKNLWAFGGFPKRLFVNGVKHLQGVSEIVQWKANELMIGKLLPIQKAQAVLDYINREIQWVDDWKAYKVPDYWETAEEVIKSGRSDCEGKAFTAYKLLRACGFSADELKISAEIGHIFCQCRVNNEWNTIDPIKSYYVRALLHPETVLIEWNEKGVL